MIQTTLDLNFTYAIRKPSQLYQVKNLLYTAYCTLTKRKIHKYEEYEEVAPYITSSSTYSSWL